MVGLLKKLVSETHGQDLAEYGVALAVIAVGAGAAALIIAQNVGTLWSNAQDKITSVVSAE